MDPRASHLISALQLAPHPEGGHYRRVYRSAASVQPEDGRSARAALTTTFFLLAEGEVSRWHSVRSDEVWHFYEGAPLDLLRMDGEFRRVKRERLGPVGEEVQPVRVVPANEWQAALSTGAYTLVGCTVGPGFEFEDFRMLGDNAAEVERLRQRQADVVELV